MTTDAAPGPTSPTGPTGPTVDLIVLAGGRGSRLGGALKPAVEVFGRTLLSRVLDARPLARHTVVVAPDAAMPAAASGDQSPASATGSPLIWTLEDPPFGGPVAAIAAGLTALTEHARDRTEAPADWVLLLACDLPWAADAAPLLLAAVPTLPSTVAGVHLVDVTGRAQWLAGIYRGRPLAASVARLGSDVQGASMRALLGGLELRGLIDAAGASRDVDTWQDVADSTDLLRRGAAPAAHPPHPATPSQETP